MCRHLGQAPIPSFRLGFQTVRRLRVTRREVEDRERERGTGERRGRREGEERERERERDRRGEERDERR